MKVRKTMKKKFLALLTCITVALGTTACSTSKNNRPSEKPTSSIMSDTGSSDTSDKSNSSEPLDDPNATSADSFQYTEKDGEITIKKYIGTDKDVVIPCKIKGKPVTSIHMNNVFSLSGIESVVIPGSITKVSGFINCTSLKSVTISDGTAEIGAYAFEGCTSLTSVTLPEGMTRIGRDAFKDTPWLENKRKEDPLVIEKEYLIDGKACDLYAVVPDGVKIIADGAFAESWIMQVYIPDSLTSIGAYAFYKCSNLMAPPFDETNTNLTEIGEGAFSGCTGLFSVDLPKSVSIIHKFTFQNCKELISFTINDMSVTAIDVSAFENCKSLTTLGGLSGVTFIGDKAFSGCSEMIACSLSDDLTHLGKDAFAQCGSIIITHKSDTYTYRSINDLYKAVNGN